MTHYDAATSALPFARFSLHAWRAAGLALGVALAPTAWAADADTSAGVTKPAAVTASASAPAKPAVKAVRGTTLEKAKPEDALFTETGSAMVDKIRATLSKTTVADKNAPTAGRSSANKRSKPAPSEEAHWSYEGESGPQAWGNLKPDFTTCASGKRQSPINIEDGATLHGPAEPLQFSYSSSNAAVVNNGHTIQVDVQGENTITVRDSTYRLLQFHFHTPSEEQINGKRFPMVAHLVHKNGEGQLAVVAVLLEEGEASPFIDKVWTYMPLDSGDRVRMPADLLNLSELLPTDQRYYQFMGSLTTPPCTEGVLWNVLKTPVTVSREQLKLFSQIFPNNARPVQALNGRIVREGM